MELPVGNDLNPMGKPWFWNRINISYNHPWKKNGNKTPFNWEMESPISHNKPLIYLIGVPNRDSHMSICKRWIGYKNL